MATPRFTLGGANGWPIKEGSVLAYENTNGLFKPAPFDVARNSGGSYVDANGLIQTEHRPNWPRITYSGGRACLMNEEARTNVLTYSEEFDNADWGKSNVTISANATTAPDGTTTADKVVENTANSAHATFRVGVITSAGTYNLSLFAKKSERDRIYLGNSSSGTNYSVFDLENGAYVSDIGSGIVTLSNQEITALENDWYRVSVTLTTPSAISLAIGMIESGTTTSYLGDGSSGLFVWGAQIEAGSYASSYIKTEGAAATRAAESIQGLNLGNFLGDSEGTLYFEGSFSEDGRISLSDGTVNNRAVLLLISGNLNGLLVVSGTNTGNFGSTAIDYETNYKIALKYAANDFALWINGIEVGTNTTSATFVASTLTNVQFNTGDGINSPFYGLTKVLEVYDTALTDTQLTSLTT